MRRSGGSIRDVARDTGLSTATVSRVMNGNKSVSHATRQRVLDACRRLDYVPNPAARALSTKRSKTIAAIIPNIEHSVFSKFVTAIEVELATRGYSLVLAISNGDIDEEFTAARKLLGMGAEAFVLSGSAHDPALLDMLARRSVPFAFTSVWDAKQAAPTIGYDNAALAADAMTHLADKGHTEIAVLHGPLANNDRTAARKRGAENAALDVANVRYFETDLSVAGGRTAMANLLRSRFRATATLCFSDVLALGAYFELASAGVRVPDDMSVMGFDNLDWARETVPPLTTVNLPAEAMGHSVAAQIMDHLETDSALTDRLLQAEIVQRASVRDLRV